jgi:DNA repair exonuclease SbcCD nuclease subunit
MKIAILSDTHAGIKNGSDIFLNYSERFYSEVFFPYCLEHGITKIIHAGDYFDHRKYVNYKVLFRNRKMFLEKLREYGMTMDIIPGNHDVAYKNTNNLSGLHECISLHSDVVNIFMEPTVQEYDGFAIGLLPWITADNYANSMDFIQKCPASVLVAHLELAGFEMMKGAPVVASGMSREVFSGYQMVLTGHYHTKSSIGNIHYLGSNMELTWADADDPKYFHVLDTSDVSLTPVRNPLCIYQRVIYNDAGVESPIVAVHEADLTCVTGTFVKVIVVSKKDPFAFDKFLDKIQANNPFDLKVVESYEEFAATAVEDENIDLGNTSSLLSSYVDAIETELDKDRIKAILQQLYAEAQDLDAL